MLFRSHSASHPETACVLQFFGFAILNRVFVRFQPAEAEAAAPPNPVPPHEPLCALCICNFVIEEVQLAEAAGGRGCRPSEPLLPAREEAGHSKLLRAAQTLDLSRS